MLNWGKCSNLKKCELGVLRAQIAELWEVGGINMPAVQALVSTHLSWFSKFVIMDGSILDDAFKELQDIDAILMEKDD